MDTPEGKKSVTALAVALAVAATFLTPNASVAGASTSEAPTVGLKLVRRIVLAKPKGRVDQVVPLPKGGFVLRDADFDRERFQAVEVYAATGRRLRQLGRFGQRPGSYYRLRSIALSGGTVLVADVVGRVTLFSEQGAFLGTKLVQNPGYQIDSIAVDEERGFFYLGGCLPAGIYVDRGCRLVHQYQLKDKKYLRSFLKSDPETVSNGTSRWSDINIDTDPQGRVVAVDAPSFKLLRIDPLSGAEEVFPIRSQKVKPLGTLVEPNDAKRHYSSSALVERVVVVAPWVVVAVRRPKDAGFLLQIFDDQGRQVGIDLDPPGKLVGESSAGGLLFASSTGTGWEIAEFSLVSTPPVP
jgi:hypothetical protein